MWAVVQRTQTNAQPASPSILPAITHQHFDLIDVATDTGSNPDWKHDLEQAVHEVKALLEYKGVDIFKSQTPPSSWVRGVFVRRARRPSSRRASTRLRYATCAAAGARGSKLVYASRIRLVYAWASYMRLVAVPRTRAERLVL